MTRPDATSHLSPNPGKDCHAGVEGSTTESASMWAGVSPPVNICFPGPGSLTKQRVNDRFPGCYTCTSRPRLPGRRRWGEGGPYSTAAGAPARAASHTQTFILPLRLHTACMLLLHFRSQLVGKGPWPGLYYGRGVLLSPPQSLPFAAKKPSTLSPPSPPPTPCLTTGFASPSIPLGKGIGRGLEGIKTSQLVHLW